MYIVQFSLLLLYIFTDRILIFYISRLFLTGFSHSYSLKCETGIVSSLIFETFCQKLRSIPYFPVIGSHTDVENPADLLHLLPRRVTSIPSCHRLKDLPFLLLKPYF